MLCICTTHTVHVQLDLSVRLELVKRSQRMCQQRLRGEPGEGGLQLLKSELETYYKHLKILSSQELSDVIEKYSVDKVTNVRLS